MFEIQLINTETLIVLEEKTVTHFKDVRYILGNSNLLNETLNLGNKKIKVLYNEIELFSYTEQHLLYPLKFNDLVNKIDFNLLDFSPIALLLQQNKLRSPLLDHSLTRFNLTKLGNISYIKFKNGISISIDDIEVDGYFNVDPQISIGNKKIIVNLILDGLPIKTYSYSIDDIEKIIWYDFGSNGVQFEVLYEV